MRVYTILAKYRFGFNVFFMSNINSDELGNSFMHESLFLSVFNTFRQPTTHYKNSALFSVIFRRAQKTTNLILNV